MAVHLTRIYTRTGDDGNTGLSDFSRVAKNDPRLVAYADCDETNAAIGTAIALGNPPPPMSEVLRWLQNDLFDAGADLSTPVVADPKYPPLRITQDYIDRLEGWCDEFNESLPTLDSFILPGGTALSALLHTARTDVYKRQPTPSTHRLRRGLPGYLILFAPHAFAPQRQLRPRDPPSPPVFLLISAHSTAPPGIPFSPTFLKSARIESRLRVEP